MELGATENDGLTDGAALVLGPLEGLFVGAIVGVALGEIVGLGVGGKISCDMPMRSQNSSLLSIKLSIRSITVSRSSNGIRIISCGVMATSKESKML